MHLFFFPRWSFFRHTHASPSRRDRHITDLRVTTSVISTCTGLSPSSGWFQAGLYCSRLHSRYNRARSRRNSVPSDEAYPIKSLITFYASVKSLSGLAIRERDPRTNAKLPRPPPLGPKRDDTAKNLIRITHQESSNPSARARARAQATSHPRGSSWIYLNNGCIIFRVWGSAIRYTSHHKLQ